MEISQLIKNINRMNPITNTYLKTFINTVNDTFDPSLEISIWTNEPSVLFYDIRDMDHLSISVLDHTGSYEQLPQKVSLLKLALSTDFNTEFTIVTSPYDNMIELWSTTKRSEFFMDHQFSEEDKGKTIYVPYDYYLCTHPIIFLPKDTELKTDFGNCVNIDSPAMVTSMFPYEAYTI